jgi:hypothetical protein
VVARRSVLSSRGLDPSFPLQKETVMRQTHQIPPTVRLGQEISLLLPPQTLPVRAVTHKPVLAGAVVLLGKRLFGKVSTYCPRGSVLTLTDHGLLLQGVVRIDRI